MNIAEVSKKIRPYSDTLRYYERIGLLPAVARNKAATAITAALTASA